MTLILFVMEPEMETLNRRNRLDDDGQVDETCSSDRLKQNMANS